MKKWIMPSIVLVVLAWLVVLTVQAGPLGQRSEPAESPQATFGTAFTYQGQLKDGSALVNDDCEMAFRLYDQDEGGDQVGSTLTQTVTIADGLFTANLDFGGGVFDGDERWLDIQVQCPGDSGFAGLGRQELTAAPYALYAARSGGPENVVIVAKSGGDYTSVRTALDSINDATADNPYLVWVGPGVYQEAVALKPYVHLQGAGQEVTILSSTVGNADWTFITATLVLTANSNVSDLTVENNTTQSGGIAILATAGSTQTQVADVIARARGNATSYNIAICLTGSDMRVFLQNVSALAEGSSQNYGLHNADGAQAILQGGVFQARGGYYAKGISNDGSTSILDAQGVTALAEGAGDNRGLNARQGAQTTLSGGSFTARGGSVAYGILNTSSFPGLIATGVMALGEDGTDSRGLFNYAQATLYGGSFTARGGTYAYGIDNYTAHLAAENVTALGEDGTQNAGLYNHEVTRAELRGGSFTGRGGTYAYGLHNRGATALLAAENVTALGEDGSQTAGLYNQEGARAELRGGSFTGRGGNSARGIYSYDDTSYLEAERVSALAEGSGSNRGLESSVGADVVITESVIEGSAVSIVTSGGGGPVTASNSRLVGGPATGNVSCTAMSRGTTFNVSGCP